MGSVLVLIVYQYSWIVFILVVVANAVFWRMEARDRIKVDPSLRRPLNRLYGGFVFWLSLPFLMMGAGIVTGNVDNIFQFLKLDSGNPFIIATQALLFAEDALFIYWVFFRRGDHLLALHTEIAHARPKLRVGARILAIALPFLHGAALYQATFSPHFGQFFGAHAA